MARVANPYVNTELKMPREHLESVQTYTMTFKGESGAAKDIDRSPFGRYVDLWWAAIGVGVGEGRMTAVDRPHKFVTGAVFNEDPWRIVHLELLAIAETGGSEVLKSPGDVIEIANAYAATGIPLLIEELLRKTEPIWDVSNFLQEKAVESD